MNPATFELHQGLPRAKYDLGLFDVSACLLNPARLNISHQMYNYDPLVRTLVLMPVPKMMDAAVFVLLNNRSKALRASYPGFRSFVQSLGYRFTRIKLADSADVGAGMLDISTGPAGGGLQGMQKIRYGLDFDPAKNALRKQLALQYDRIIDNMSADERAYNEIVLSYRQHDGPFPMRCQLVNGNAWQVLQIKDNVLTPADAVPDIPDQLNAPPPGPGAPPVRGFSVPSRMKKIKYSNTSMEQFQEKGRD